MSGSKGGKAAYLEMADILSHQIHTGVYRLGQRLPSETTLAERYGLSPMTVRRAIKLLAEGGLVKSVHGSGTYVAKLNIQDSSFNFNIYKNIFENRPDLAVKLLEATITFATADQARKLDTLPGGHLVAMTRLISAEGRPMALHQTFFVYNPEEPSIEAELNITSLNGLLVGEDQASFKKGLMSFRPVALNSKEAQLLGTEPGTLAYGLNVVFYDFADRPVNYGQLKVPCQQVAIEKKIGLWND